jgi:hypothetical protein
MEQIKDSPKQFIKAEAKPGAGLDVVTVTAEVQSTKLKSMLAGLKKND